MLVELPSDLQAIAGITQGDGGGGEPLRDPSRSSSTSSAEGGEGREGRRVI